LLITFYGVGTILGAGIYVLIGKVAGEAGSFTPLAFLVAACLAALSAFSYAELAARFPKSAGEAVYVNEAFAIRSLSTVVGLAIVAMGILSAATLIHGLVNYLQVFFDISRDVTLVIAALALGAVVAWGIGQSVGIAALFTVIEVFGLLLILWVARHSYVDIPAQLPEMFLPLGAAAWTGILAGAFIAFYAYIGFEDIVNVAEEVKDPLRNLPRAIIASLIITTVLYMAVSVASLVVAGAQQLAGNDAPLAMVYQVSTGKAPVVITVISLVSVLNGALVQVIMASRILYGMSRQGWLPALFGRVSALTHTPLYSTACITALVLVFALGLPLLSLAKLTSFVTLTVFSLINLSLLRIKWRARDRTNTFTVPIWVPASGFILTTTFVVFQLVSL
jgi:amino acid transporter